MLRMVQTELRRITYSMVTRIGILLAIFFVLLLLFLDIKSVERSVNDKQILMGIEAKLQERKWAEEVDYGVITNEKVKEDLDFLRRYYKQEKKLSRNDMKTSLPSKVYYSHYLPRESYYLWVQENYLGWGSYGNEFSKILENQSLPSFEEGRVERVKKILDKNKFQGKAWEFLLKMEENSRGPYEYGYFEGWDWVIKFLYFVPIVVLVISISVGHLFSEDYETGSYEVLYSSRYGRNKLFFARIFASFLFMLGVMTVFLGVGIFGLFFFLTMDGGDLPIQAMSTLILYPWTIKETFVWQIALICLGGTAVVILSLAISLLSKRTFVNYGVLLGFYAVSRYSSMMGMGENRLLGRIVVSFPFCLGMDFGYERYQVYYFFGKPMTFYEFVPGFYLLLLPLVVLFLYVFQQQQDQKKYKA